VAALTPLQLSTQRVLGLEKLNKYCNFYIF